LPSNIAKRTLLGMTSLDTWKVLMISAGHMRLTVDEDGRTLELEIYQVQSHAPRANRCEFCFSLVVAWLTNP